MRTLVDFEKEFQDILNSDTAPYQKDLKLGRLLSSLEAGFSIPAMKNDAWERENEAVITLYRTISNSRNL